jgi:hypothetical protein
VISTKLAEDAGLSFAARGMMLYLLCKPDNWQVRMGDLERAANGMGEQATRTVFGELEAAGYVVRTKARNPKTGQWVYDTTVYESPVAVDAPTERGATADGPTVDGDTVDGSAVCGSAAHGSVLPLPITQSPSTHSREDANASSQAAPAGAPKREPREPSALQAQHNAAQTAVREHFERRTGLAAPEKGTAKGLATLWWNPIREICTLADWDVGRAVRVVDATLDRLKGLTVSDPNSIIKTARSVAAERKRQESRPVMAGGAIMMPSSRVGGNNDRR